MDHDHSTLGLCPFCDRYAAHPDEIEGCPCGTCNGEGYFGRDYLLEKRVPCWNCNGTGINRNATIVAKTSAYLTARGTHAEVEAWKALIQLFEDHVWKKTSS